MRDGSPSTWSAKVAVTQQHATLFEPLFDGLTGVVSLYEDPAQKDQDDAAWWVEGLFTAPPPRTELGARLAVIAQAAGVAEPALVVAPIAPRDWLTENIASFTPVTVGRYFVHGDHVRGPYPAGKIRLCINAATAFGSGEHASTAGCLLALDGLARRSPHACRPMLDMGCGSGILALAMAKTWPAAVVAADIDPEAVRVTRGNARRNGVGKRVRATIADGCAAALVLAPGPYGVITANILARPLSRMARDLARLLAPGGYLILSGLLRRQEAMVLSAYRTQHLRLVRRIVQLPWNTLVLERSLRRCPAVAGVETDPRYD